MHATMGEPSTTARPWWRRPMTWIGLGLSALAIATIAWRFDRRALVAALLQLRWWAPLLSLGFFLGNLAVRGLRWRLLLSPLARLPQAQVRDALIVGFMVNNLLPARAGELARALIVGRLGGFPGRAGLASVAVERLFDGFALLAALVLLALLFPVPPWTRHFALTTAVVLSALGAALVWLALHDRTFFAALGRLLFFVPAAPRDRAIAWLRRFVDGTRAVRSPRVLLGAALLSLVVWLFEAGSYTSMLRGLPIAVPVWAGTFALVVANLGIAIPSGPSNIGVFEAACSVALLALGVTPELALAYALCLHVLHFSTVVLLGLPLMWRLGLRLSDLSRPQASEPQPPPV